MVDFAVLPPEVTSARMYAGPGSGPLVAAAVAWDRLASTLGSAAGSYRSVVAELTAQSWRGPGSASMAAAAEPYVEWMTTTAAQAGVAANQARAAAAAYEAAHAGVVPPPVIAANRAQLSALVANNVLGQNSAAIAANQAQYSQMWAQDVAVMHSYAASSAAASDSVTTFNPPPKTALNPTSGNTAYAAAPGQLGGPIMDFLNNNPLQGFLASPFMQGLNGLSLDTEGFQFLVGGVGYFGDAVNMGGATFPVFGAIQAALVFGAVDSGMPEMASATERKPDAPPPATLAGAYGPREVSAGVGQAAPVGELSTPRSWAAATPQGARLAATALPMPTTGFPAASHHLPAVVSVVNAPRKAKAAKGTRGKAELGPDAAEQAGGDARVAVAMASKGATRGQSELERLRQAVAELKLRRNSLQDEAAERIEKATR